MSDTFCCLNQNLDRSVFLQQKNTTFACNGNIGGLIFSDLEDADHLDPFDFSLSYSFFVYFGVWFENTSEPQDAFSKNLDM